MIRSDGLTRVILALLSLAVLAGADWPQYRYDAGRTAATSEQLSATLYRQWVHRFPAPQPAFPAEVRLRFDASYEPVVLGKRIFVPSMVTDSVSAFDTDTGDLLWQYFTEGPVRFAPVAWQGNVYFVSDDGHLYCVDAAGGQLKWKFEGRPSGARERKILGNRRLVSLWPAWGGPVLHEGVLYFGCGIWSTYGVCVHAVDATSGQVIWTNADSNQIPKANMDHGIANVAGLTPQGYLAVVNNQLVVPCGAQLPAFLDLKTGELGTYCMGWGGRNGLPKGTWFVAGEGRYLSHSGDLYDITRVNDEKLGDPRWPTDFKSMLYPGEFTRLCIDRTNQKDLGDFSQPVFASGVLYASDQGISAYDLSEVKVEERGRAENPPYRKDDTYPDKWTATFRQQWLMPSQRKVQIKAGQHLYLSGPGAVEAFRIPQPGEEPQAAWQAQIDGSPHRLLAADGKLFVVTREGSLFAFGPQESANPGLFSPPAAAEPPADAWTNTAADILQASGVREGYALVLGFASGRLVEQLARHSDLYVIAIGRDADRADDLRRQLHRAGLYGTRVSVHVGDPLSYPLPPYLANLVVSEDWDELGTVADPRVLEALYHPLRPYGGTVCLPTAVVDRETLDRRLSEHPLASAAVRQTGQWILLSRQGPLPGSADWSHAEANAAGTGASEDQFIRAPFDLLWFDTPRRWFRTPGSTLVRVCDGRVLIKSDRLQAIDVYTGRKLWETPLAVPHNANDQFVAVQDAIYLTSGTNCLVLDPGTGKTTGKIELPEGLADAWSNVRVWQDYLVAQSGRHLVCLNRDNGQLIWKSECRQPALSVAVGGGKVFCAELANPRRGESPQADAATRALDIATGRELWQVPGGSEIRYSLALDAVVTNTSVYRAADGSKLAGLPVVDMTDPKIRPQNLPKPQLVVGQELLFGTAENLALYDLATGGRESEPFLWTRRGCTIPRASSHLITTRVRGNAACIDLESREIVPLWNVRAACSNNLFPADGVLNVPSMTGGCTCNYIPVSQAFVPASVISRSPGARKAE